MRRLKRRLVGPPPPSAPLLIAGVGGSGTRVIARFARHAGLHMGLRLNDAEDSRPVLHWLRCWLRPYLKDGGALPRSSRSRLELDLTIALELHLGRERPPALRWGLKVPPSVLLLPLWHELFPGLAFVHVVRDGRDMAYSMNRNQLNDVGDLVLSEAERASSPEQQAIAYWQRANVAAADYGEVRLGPRYLRMRFEDVCADPAAAYRRLCEFVSADAPAPPDVAIREVTTPASLGRWRSRPEEEVRRLVVVASAGLARLGYAADGRESSARPA